MMEPAVTVWPANSLKPSRLALLSRPLRELPTPFLCAISVNLVLRIAYCVLRIAYCVRKRTPGIRGFPYAIRTTEYVPLRRNRLDLQLGVELAVAEAAALVLFGLEGKAFDLAALVLPRDLSRDLGAVDIGGADFHAAVRAD